MADFFILLAVGTLLGMIDVVVIVDKLSSLGAEIEPIGDELRPIDSLFHLGTSCYHFECVLQAMWLVPLLVTLVILRLKER